MHGKGRWRDEGWEGVWGLTTLVLWMPGQGVWTGVSWHWAAGGPGRALAWGAPCFRLLLTAAGQRGSGSGSSRLRRQACYSAWVLFAACRPSSELTQAWFWWERFSLFLILVFLPLKNIKVKAWHGCHNDVKGKTEGSGCGWVAEKCSFLLEDIISEKHLLSF